MRLSIAFAAASLLLATGCIQLGGEEPVVHRHAIDAVAVTAPAGPTLGSLAVRTFVGRERYDARVVVRSAEGAIELLDAERWVEDPAEALAVAVAEALGGSGAFESVTAAASAFDTDLVLDGHLLACDVVEDDGRRSAVLRLQLDLAEAATGAIVHSGQYQSSRPLPALSDLGSAVSAGAAEILADALRAWRLAGSGRR